MANKTPFVRELDNKIINQLKASGNNSIFPHLCKDAKQFKTSKETVFPAIRNNSIDFYYRGGKLFSYQNQEFSTHHKYASVLANASADYIKEAQLKKLSLITNFGVGYERIKENCSLYSGVESNGVSELYGKYSYLFPNSPIVILDIEVALETTDILSSEQTTDNRRKTYDRIDILLFDKGNTTLRFYEAKHFTNRELWAKKNAKPPVVNQIKRYEEQIKNRKTEILSSYTRYVDIANNLFGLSLPKPLEIDDKVGLLIFGFDNDQLKGRFTEILLSDGSLDGIHKYCIGNISSVKIENLWKQTK